MMTWVNVGSGWAPVEVVRVHRGRRRAVIRTTDGKTGTTSTALLYRHGGLCKCRACRTGLRHAQ